MLICPCKWQIATVTALTPSSGHSQRPLLTYVKVHAYVYAIYYRYESQYLAGFLICLCDLRSVTEIEVVCESVTILAAACDVNSASVLLSFGS